MHEDAILTYNMFQGLDTPNDDNEDNDNEDNDSDDVSKEDDESDNDSNKDASVDDAWVEEMIEDILEGDWQDLPSDTNNSIEANFDCGIPNQSSNVNDSNKVGLGHNQVSNGNPVSSNGALIDDLLSQVGNE